MKSYDVYGYVIMGEEDYGFNPIYVHAEVLANDEKNIYGIMDGILKEHLGFSYALDDVEFTYLEDTDDKYEGYIDYKVVEDSWSSREPKVGIEDAKMAFAA